MSGKMIWKTERLSKMKLTSVEVLQQWNICRSPIAEAVFLNILKYKGLQDTWKVDSAGLGGWFTGKSPDSRALTILRNHRIVYHGTARKICQKDFEEFQYVFGMDEQNIKELNKIKPEDSQVKILLLGDFDPEGERIIKDPYYSSGLEMFETCYRQCLRSCRAFIDNFEKYV